MESDSWSNLDEGPPTQDTCWDPWLRERIAKGFGPCYTPNRMLFWGSREVVAEVRWGKCRRNLYLYRVIG